MQEVFKGKSLDEETVKDLLNLRPEQIDRDLLVKYFAYTSKNKPKFCSKDYFVLPAGKLYNKTAETTTVGRYIFNLLILNESLGKYIEYMNEPMTDEKLEGLTNKVAQLLLEKKITPQDERDFFDKTNWFGFSTARYVNASLAAEFVMTNPVISKKKKELLAKNANEIENGNMKVAADIENELLKDAKDIFKDHPSMQIYNSGCRGSFGNNYKCTSIMRGVVKDFADPSKSYISTSNLDEGITPDEFKYYCDMSIAGTYGKAIETQDGISIISCFNEIFYICCL